MINKSNLGTNFDIFLEEEELLQESEAVALKRVIAYALKQKMKDDNISVNHLAKELETSRTAICRILDPENTSITLSTIVKVAKYLGKGITLSFV
jgi:transcriptional antiterminator